MTKIYDFTKYKAEQEISMYEAEREEIKHCFSCPECEGIGFIIYTDMEVSCVECHTTVGLGVE